MGEEKKVEIRRREMRKSEEGAIVTREMGLQVEQKACTDSGEGDEALWTPSWALNYVYRQPSSDQEHDYATFGRHYFCIVAKT